MRERCQHSVLLSDKPPDFKNAISNVSGLGLTPTFLILRTWDDEYSPPSS
jgi:hypothetical protein